MVSWLPFPWLLCWLFLDKKIKTCPGVKSTESSSPLYYNIPRVYGQQGDGTGRMIELACKCTSTPHALFDSRNPITGERAGDTFFQRGFKRIGVINQKPKCCCCEGLFFFLRKSYISQLDSTDMLTNRKQNSSSSSICCLIAGIRRCVIIMGCFQFNCVRVVIIIKP
jgi:hypothetical protein